MTQYMTYDSAYYGKREVSPTFQAEVKTILKFVSPKKKDTILELGCGSGAVLNALLPYGCKLIVGLDWLETSVTLTKKRAGNLLAISGDAKKLPFCDETFTKLIMQHLIEHFKDTVKVIQEWKRVLKPGGKLTLATPNRLFPHQEWFDDPSHYKIFTEDELSHILESAGLVVVNSRVINPYIFDLRFMGVAARYFQVMHRVSYLAKTGMSIVMSAKMI